MTNKATFSQDLRIFLIVKHPITDQFFLAFPSVLILFLFRGEVLEIYPSPGKSFPQPEYDL